METTIQSLPVDQLKPNPWNRTVFDPQQIEDLAASIKEGGVREPLIVRPNPDGGYQIASGHRRWLASQKAGLAEVPCLVQPLTDEQVAEMDVVNNVQRENIPPLELARIVQAYMDQFHKTQGETAKRFGKSQAWVSDLTGFLKIPQEVQKNISALIIAWNPLMALKKAPPEVQTQVSQELKEGKTKPQDAEKRCNQLRFGGGKAAAPHASNSPDQGSDPLASFWPTLTMNPAIAPINSWKVSYGSQGWNFWLSGNTPTPKATIKRWLLALADSMGDTHAEENRAHKVMDTLLLTDRAEIARAKEEAKNLRTPQTPQEWTELESRAQDGPGAVYAWSWGENSLMAQKAKSLSWANLGEQDPVAGCHKIIDSVQEMMGISNR